MLRTRRWPLTILATTAAAAVLGCGHGCPDARHDDGALVLGAATLVSTDEVCLAFSEAVAPPTGVDPQAFRISRAVTLSKGHPIYQACSCGFTGNPPPCYTCAGFYATYEACLEAASQAFDDAANCLGSSAADGATVYYDVTDPLPTLVPGFDQLEQTSPRHVRAKLHAELSAFACGSGEVDVGHSPLLLGERGLPKFFLHYSGADPAIAAEGGETLGPIAPAFATTTRPQLVVPGHFPGGPLPLDAEIFTTICVGGG